MWITNELTMKKKIYIDIDGVLLDYKTGTPAEHAEKLIEFLTSGRYDCYWLTTHCKGNKEESLAYLSQYFSGKVMKRLTSIKPTDWSDMKTEAIDLTGDFIWLEDYPFQAEMSELYKYRKEESLYKVDLTRKDDLLNAIDFIRKHGKNKSMKIRRPSKRFWFIAAAIVVAFALIYSSPRGRMLIWRMMTKPTDYVKTITIRADRGEIFDYLGNVIATNKYVYDLHLDCCVIQNPNVWEEKSRRLAQEIALILPERTAPEWWDYFQNARKNKKRYLPIVKKVDYSMIDTLSKLPIFNDGKYKGGKIVTETEARDYPYGTLARRTIGAWSNVEYDYLFGLERQFDGDLSGTDGSKDLKVGVRRGRRRQWEISSTDKINGWDIHTTLDMKKQAVADSVLRAAVASDEDIVGGCIALMEVKTGAVATLANIHTLDNGAVGEYYNYLLNHSYEPGEVAQTMTLAAALSDGFIKSLEDKMPTNHGRVSDTSAIRDDYIIRYERKTQSDSITIMDGFSMSSRYVASSLATRYAESPDYYYQWFKTFCIGRYNFDIYMNDLDLVNPLGRDTNTLLSMGNGYEFTVCPMQILAFYNTIANDGKLMEPLLVKRMQSDKYGTQYMWPKELNECVIRKDVTDSVKRALTSCVESGTGRALKDLPIKVAGKTGTARQIMDPRSRKGSNDPYQDIDGRRQYASTFAGFFPADEPQYSVICVLYTKPTHKSLHGGMLPAETVRHFIEGIENLR